MAGMSPTQLSLRHMRAQGYVCEVVERWDHFAKRRKDLYGMVDVLCLGTDEVVGVQATSYSNVSARVNKIANHENVDALREAGVRLLVHGWRLVDRRWTMREVDCS